jgi:hypothetical protein
VVKNYHFKKGSYVVGVDYKISNNSNQTIPVKSYDGLDYTLSFAKVKDSDNSAAYNTLNEKNTIFSISKSF